MSNDDKSRQVQELELLRNLMQELRTQRRRALVVLIFLLVSLLLVQSFGTDDMPVFLFRACFLVAIAGFGLASGIFLMATVLLRRAGKEHDQVSRGRA